MKYGFSLIMRGHEATVDAFVKMAQKAEELEIDALWCSAHIIVPPQVNSHYANVPGAKYPDTWKELYWEPVSVLSYLAAHTKKINLGTSITVLPMHNPFEIAKQVAEIDQFSNGRFVFGVGVGWFEEEFEVLGQDFHNRGARTDEALDLMRTLWEPDPVNFEGQFYQVKDAYFAPKPVQEPHPPIWIAGNSKHAMRRAARVGDAWHPVRPDPDTLAASIADLQAMADEAGRAPGSVETAVKCPMLFQDSPPGEGQAPTQGRPQDIIDAIKRYEDAGANYYVFDFVPEAFDMAMETMERFANEVRPKL